mmetsp:Transcript_107396/g.309196  ORF Transcript_107396/g.309196 Transcript_107396/m.309196 type:complete len:258 (-) Transcript_107396:175-948(-)
MLDGHYCPLLFLPRQLAARGGKHRTVCSVRGLRRFILACQCPSPSAHRGSGPWLVPELRRQLINAGVLHRIVLHVPPQLFHRVEGAAASRTNARIPIALICVDLPHWRLRPIEASASSGKFRGCRRCRVSHACAETLALFSQAGWRQRAEIVDAMHNLRGQRQQDVASQLIVRLLQAHWKCLICLLALSVVPDAITTNSGLNQVLGFHFAHLEDKIQRPINFLDDGICAEQDQVGALRRTGQPDEDRANHHRIQKVG